MKLLKTLSLLIFSIFLFSTISAMTTYLDWNDGTASATINSGDSISFNVDFLSMNTPMNTKVLLYDSQSNLIYTFLEQTTNDKWFSTSYTLDSSIYIGEGDFSIIVQGTDKYQSDSSEIALKVTSIDMTIPVITSTAITQANENTAYTYDVNATDADGDTLIYSLTQSPSWLSIDSATGLISGTSPVVNSDTNYNIIIGVSDGTNSGTQSYTLTVTNVPLTGNNAPVITSSPITDIDEEDDYAYNVDATDADGDTLIYSLASAPAWLSINSATGLITGTAPSVSSDTDYTVIVQVSDGTDYDEQTFTLTVDNVSSNGGGISKGVRQVETSQPVKSTTGQTGKTTPTTAKKTSVGLTAVAIIFYSLIAFTSLGIFFVSYLLVQRVKASR
jgi:hypothetical protein